MPTIGTIDLDLAFDLVPAVQTITGTVKDGAGNPLVRQVVAFNENNPGDWGRTTSKSDGTWSLTVPGSKSTKFAVVEIGASDSENDVVSGHVVHG
jgi:hypothetical protein